MATSRTTAPAPDLLTFSLGATFSLPKNVPLKTQIALQRGHRSKSFGAAKAPNVLSLVTDADGHYEMAFYDYAVEL